MPVPVIVYQWPYHSFRAMGTRIKMWLEADETSAAQAFAEAEAVFRDVEKALSRFNPSSELSRLNAQPGEWVKVSKILWTVLKVSLKYAEETDGLFDPTVLNALLAAGYRETFDSIGYGGAVAPAAIPKPMHAGWQSIDLDEHSHSVKLPAGTGLDFGGIAKGYTAQWAARLMGLWGPCLVDAGGDLVAGEAPSGFAGWPVRIFAPRITGQENNHALVGLNLVNSALATSGIDHRRWMIAEREAHHLIDPRTAQPATSEALTVSVKAENGTLAEVLTKVVMIKGLDCLPELAAEQIPALVVSKENRLHINDCMMPLITGFDVEINAFLHTATGTHLAEHLI